MRERGDGGEYEIRARYVIGCDGARTIVGEQGGFEFEGQAGLGDAVHGVDRGGLVALHGAPLRRAVLRGAAPAPTTCFSIWTCVEPWTEWSTMFARHGLARNDLSEEAVLRRVRGRDRRPRRSRHDQEDQPVADQPRRRRGLPQGAAVPGRRRRPPPPAGQRPGQQHLDPGQLQPCLEARAGPSSGKAGEGLLDSYDAERQPVGRRVVDRANRSVARDGAAGSGPRFPARAERSRALASIDRLFGPAGRERRQALLAAFDLMNGQFNTHGVEMGQRYARGAVVGDGTPFPAYDPRHGSLLPPDDASRRPPAARLAPARHRGRLDPRPLRATSASRC